MELKGVADGARAASRKELLEVGSATGFADLASGGLRGGFRTVAPALREAASRMDLGRRRGWRSTLGGLRRVGEGWLERLCRGDSGFGTTEDKCEEIG